MMFAEETLWNSILQANVSEGERKQIGRRLDFGLSFEGLSSEGKSALARMASGIGRTGKALYDAIAEASQAGLLGSALGRRLPWAHLDPKQREPLTYVRAKILDTESRASEKAMSRIAQIARRHQKGAASKEEMQEALRLAMAAQLPSTTHELRVSITEKWPEARANLTPKPRPSSPSAPIASAPGPTTRPRAPDNDSPVAGILVAGLLIGAAAAFSRPTT